MGNEYSAELDVIRQFRDTRLASSTTGLFFVCLYYLHGEEVRDILSSTPELSEKLKGIFLQMVPVLNSGMEKNDSIILNKKQYLKIVILIREIEEQSSPELQRSLSLLLRKLASKELLKKVGVKIENS